MHPTLNSFFEEQVEFRLANGSPVEGDVFIGGTKLLPVEVLRGDPDAYREELNTWVDEVWIPGQEDRRRQTLELYGNAKRYTDLRQAVARSQAVALVGSGMSVPSGLPTWSGLLRKIRGFTKVGEAQLEKLLAASAFEEAADLLASGTNTKLFNERVEHDLRIDDTSVIGGAVRLMPAIFPNLVITTNLDDLLEQHYRLCGMRFECVLAGEELARFRQLKNPAERFLLKLHGDCRRSEGRILLTDEYEKAYAHGGVIREELALLYRTNSVLFLGCSLGPDRTVRLVAEVAKEDKNMPKHYAFLALPDVNDERVERENFLTERGIYPIWYNGEHDECNLALLAGLLRDEDFDRAAR